MVTPSGERWRELAGAGCGLAAGAVALAAAQIGGTQVDGALPPLQVLGGLVIQISPIQLTEAVIGQVGGNDKTLLIAGIVVVAALAAAAVGVRFVRGGIRPALVGIGLLVLLPVLATLAGTGASFGWQLLVMAPSGLLGAAVLLALARPLLLSGAPEPTPAPADQALPRRQLLRAGLVVAAVAAVGPPLVRRLSRPPTALATRLTRALPPPKPLRAGSPASKALPALVDEFSGQGAAPLVTPVSQFYRIDTALAVPQVDPESWRLSITRDGSLLRQFGYDELVELANQQADITIGCVSNPVGGDLIGTARWRGVLLADLLKQAGVDRAPRRITGVSVDSWFASFRGELAYDGRPAMVAVGMNGDPLPVLHGFPARLIVPGLYGYTSATKWLQVIDVSDSAGLPGYWAQRGWDNDVDVHVMSRIDAPHDGDTVAAGQAVLAGIAWAPLSGVAKVEVQVDDGAWTAATLSKDVGGTLWRQWMLVWSPSPGKHVVRVRATDADGKQQDSTVRDVFPSGSTGFHQIGVTAD